MPTVKWLLSLRCDPGWAASPAVRRRQRRERGPMLRLPMAQIKTQITQELVDYLARHSRQDDVLARVEKETAAMPLAMMATTPDEAALLSMLARLIGARRALEIGTFMGYGAISIARGPAGH
jgi:hypothetical protein